MKHELTPGEKFAHETQAHLADLLHRDIITEAEFDLFAFRIRSAVTTEHLVKMATSALERFRDTAGVAHA